MGEIFFPDFRENPHKTNFILMFWAIRSSQNVEKNRTVISGLKFSRNLPYGIDSSLPIMFFRPFLTLPGPCLTKKIYVLGQKPRFP